MEVIEPNSGFVAIKVNGSVGEVIVLPRTQIALDGKGSTLAQLEAALKSTSKTGGSVEATIKCLMIQEGQFYLIMALGITATEKP